MNPAATAPDKTKEISLARKVSIVLADRMNRPKPVKADANGNLPTSIMVLMVGMWRTPYHGDIMITPEDLQEYADNFAAGMGLAKHGKAPIDYSHDSWAEAAGWMTKLYVKGDALWADVEWTTKGAQALVDGEYKCFSPEFFPKGRGGWMDPEDYDHIVENVVVGGGLTNIPLFKDLEPVMASASMAVDGNKNVIFIKASETKEQAMNLEDVRKKDPSTLTEAEKTFVAEHKAELTADEQKAFGLEVTATPPAADPAATPPAADPAANADEDTAALPEGVPAPVAASIKAAGLAVVKADDLHALQDTAKRYETEKAEQLVDSHIARGAIVADQKPRWVSRLLASRGDARKELEADLAALPNNQVMGSKQGADAKAGEATGVLDELKEKTLAHVKAAAEGGRQITYATAQEELLKQDKDLAGRVEAHRNSGQAVK